MKQRSVFKYCLTLLLVTPCVFGLGGFEEISSPNQDDDLIDIVKRGAYKLTASISAPSNCELELVNIDKASKQIVQGIIYKFDLVLDLIGPNCEEVAQKKCSNVRFFEPLPFQCEDPECLKLDQENDISCADVTETVKFGGYSRIPSPGEDQDLKATVEDGLPILAQSFGVPNSCQFKLVSIDKASLQIVAGVNYEVDLVLESFGDGCTDTDTKKCTKLTFFQPLPGECSGAGCTKLGPTDEVSCTSLLEGNENPPLVGGFGLIQKPETNAGLSAALSAGISQISESVGVTSTDCALKVVSIEKAQSQVVAGVNYLVDLVLETCDGGEKKLCKNIKLYKPLPHVCTGCVRLIDEENIICQSA